jgi:phosphorylcholine metabolism protein LicD
MFLLLLLFTIFSYANPSTDARMPRANPWFIGRLYQTLKIVDQIFTEHNIPYWIDGGTLLGAVRHGGIIPWDYDADIEIFDTDRERVLALKEEFARYGLIVERWIWGVNIYTKNYTHEHPLDIFMGHFDEEGQIFKIYDERGPQIFTKNFFYRSEIMNLQRVKLGPIEVSAPSNPLRYLIDYYGSNVMNEVLYWEKKEKRNISLKLVDKTAAKYEAKNSTIDLPAYREDNCYF